MLTTKVINDTGGVLFLKEGTAGILRILKELEDQNSYTIKVDANATYREYWCALKHNDPNAVVLSSDDCQEYIEVTIKFDKRENGYTWEGKRRDTGVKDAARNGQRDTQENITTNGSGVLPPSTPATGAPRTTGFLSWFTGLFKKSGN